MIDNPTVRERRVAVADVARILLGWGAFAALHLAGSRLDPAVVPAGTLVATLAAIIGVIVIGAFGVVHQAEALAHRLGDPYGSLVLTLSIVLIEVILIAAVMFGPGVHTTIGRDSVMAVSMIILNLVIGASLVLGGRRHGHLTVNRRGAVAYLAMISVLGGLAFAVPRWIGRSGRYSSHQALPVIAAVVVAYVVFLSRQMGRRADDFREADTGQIESAPKRHRLGPGRRETPSAGTTTPVGRVWGEHRSETATRLAVLVATMIPIVLVSHDMAALLDDGLGRLGAPTASTGVLIALIVFLPEGLTSVRAALAGELQRVSNLCHGALVSTLALTIPAVLAIGLATGQSVVLAESATNLGLLAASVALSWLTFTRRRVTTSHGIAHLVLFGAYTVTLFV